MADGITERKSVDGCECPSCVAACTQKPGWFLPDEVAEAAKFLGLTAQEFFDKYLLVDYWYGPPHTYILSPAVGGAESGGMFPFNPKGTCVFLKNDKCSIHPVKPFECREYMHDEERHAAMERHEQVAKAWENRQEVVTSVFPTPEPSEPASFLDLLSILLP